MRNRSSLQLNTTNCRSQEQQDQNELYHFHTRLTMGGNDSFSSRWQSIQNFWQWGFEPIGIFHNPLHLSDHSCQHQRQALHLKYQMQHPSSTFSLHESRRHAWQGQLVHTEERRYTLSHSKVVEFRHHIRRHYSPRSESLQVSQTSLKSFIIIGDIHQIK